MAEFVKVAKTGEIAPGERKAVDLGARRIALFNVNGTHASRMVHDFRRPGHSQSLQEGQPVFGPSAQPTNLPVTEAGTELDGRAKAQILGFQMHGVDRFGSTQSSLRRSAQSSRESGNGEFAGRAARGEPFRSR
jgi:hypothetical protein